jgi:hypothetical protein
MHCAAGSFISHPRWTMRELHLGWPSRDGTFRRVGPRPSAIGYVAKGWIAAFCRNDTSLRQMLDDIA